MPTPVHRLLRNTTFWVLTTLATLIVSIVALCIALQATSHSVKVARHEAQVASAKAVAAAGQAEEAQRQSNNRALEIARQQFCKVIEIQAAGDPPPTTARGFAAQQAYRELARTPFLHCEA